MSRPETVPYANPTLHPKALSDAERSPEFKWHSHAASPRSSQIFCLSAFGTLRSMQERDQILETLFCSAFSGFPKRERPRRWQITPEAEMPQLLSESGSQPTSIDAL